MTWTTWHSFGGFILFVALFAAFDIWLYKSGRPTVTSWFRQTLSTEAAWPFGICFTFVVGFVMGHLFW